MKLVKGLFLALVLLLVGIVVVGLFLPSTYSIERSITIDAPSAVIHRLVDDLERWPEWQPWADSDPSIVVTTGKTRRGVGAHQSWTGASGNGELTFTASDPARGIEYDLVFDESIHSDASVTYTPNGAGTEVRWEMHGDSGWDLVGRYVGLFLDGMVGPMFDAGLSKLKAAAEREGQ